MPVRKDIGRRIRAKSLKKRNEDIRNNPEKYIHETNERSKFLALDYDYNTGSLSPYKIDEYNRLKKIWGSKK